MKLLTALVNLILMFQCCRCYNFIITYPQIIVHYKNELDEGWDNYIHLLQDFQFLQLCKDVNSAEVVVANRKENITNFFSMDHYYGETLSELSEYENDFHSNIETKEFLKNEEMPKLLAYFVNQIALTLVDGLPEALQRIFKDENPYVEMPKIIGNWLYSDKGLGNFRICASLFSLIRSITQLRRKYFLLTLGSDSDDNKREITKIKIPIEKQPIYTIPTVICKAYKLHGNSAGEPFITAYMVPYPSKQDHLMFVIFKNDKAEIIKYIKVGH